MPVTRVTQEKSQSSVFLHLNPDLMSEDLITPLFPVLFQAIFFFVLSQGPLGGNLLTPKCPLPGGCPTRPPSIHSTEVDGHGTACSDSDVYHS